MGLNRQPLPVFLHRARPRRLFLAIAVTLGVTMVLSHAITAADTSPPPPATALAFQSLSRPDRRLGVPYLAQGDTNWCFETCLSMVLRYYGDSASPADIAAGLGDGPADSVSFVDMFFGPVDSLIAERPELSFRHDIRTWDFERYAARIDAGTPVITSTFGLPGHTVVVVGYTREPGGRYLYVHDPSGYFSLLQWGTSRTRYARVSWVEFSKSRWTHLVVTPAGFP